MTVALAGRRTLRIVVVGEWPVEGNTEVMRFDGTVFVAAPVHARQLQHAITEHDPHWLLIAPDLDDGTVEMLVSAGRAASAEMSIAMLGRGDDPERWDRWVRRGCSVYLSAGIRVERLLECLAASDSGRFVIVDRPLVDALRRRQAQPTEKLTRREMDVLNLLKLGLRNAEIARRLGVKSSTVEFHVRNLLEKFAARNRTGIVERARLLGL
jgi:DNA-binding NarL/FixJ family response regulator